MPDRYADAVRARRAELRALRELLAGGHRAELRTELATVKVAVAAQLGAALIAVAREFRGQVERADRRTRAVLPELLLAEVENALARERHAGLAAAAAAVRRTAGARSVPFDPMWPAPGRGSPRRRLPEPPPLEPPPGAARALLTGVAGSWRLALVPLAALPVVGIAGPALLPLAVGTGVAAVLAAGPARARPRGPRSISSRRSSSSSAPPEPTSTPRSRGAAQRSRPRWPRWRRSVRRPAVRAADGEGRVDVRAGVDTDGDGRADTVLAERNGELLLHTDLDGDGLADQVLGIAADATVRELPLPAGPGAADDMLTGLLGGVDAGADP